MKMNGWKYVVLYNVIRGLPRGNTYMPVMKEEGLKRIIGELAKAE